MTEIDFLESCIYNDYNNDIINEYTTDLLLDIITEAKSKADEFYDNYDEHPIRTQLSNIKKGAGKAKDVYVKGVLKGANIAARKGIGPINNKFNNALNKAGDRMIAKAKKSKKKIPENLEEKYRKRILAIKMASKVGIAAATNAILTPIPIPASNLALNIIYTTTISLSEDPDDKIVADKAKALANKTKELINKLKELVSKPVKSIGSKIPNKKKQNINESSNDSLGSKSVISVPKSFVTQLMNHIKAYDRFAKWYNNRRMDNYANKLENIRKTDGKLMKDVKESVDDIIDSIYECCDDNLITIEERDDLLEYLEERYSKYIDFCY